MVGCYSLLFGGVAIRIPIRPWPGWFHRARWHIESELFQELEELELEPHVQYKYVIIWYHLYTKTRLYGVSWCITINAYVALRISQAKNWYALCVICKHRWPDLRDAPRASRMYISVTQATKTPGLVVVLFILGFTSMVFDMIVPPKIRSNRSLTNKLYSKSYSYHFWIMHLHTSASFLELATEKKTTVPWLHLWQTSTGAPGWWLLKWLY